jgi:DNA-binding NtrC family response regulator
MVSALAPTTQKSPADPITVLLVDDGSGIPALGGDIAAHAGLRVLTALTPNDAFEIFERETVDIVVADITTPFVRGMEFIERLNESYPHTKIVVLTKYGTIGTAVEAMRLGASDFITRPFDLQEFRQKLESWAETAKLERINRSLATHCPTVVPRSGLIGLSTKMRGIRESIAKTSGHDCSVLILGESGTGKELVARAIHYASKRAEGLFVPVDCASLTPSLVESELFGHEKGAFTGACQQKLGMFEVAHNGTLFLDEIGELPRILQAKLLRTIQEKVVRRVGSTRLRAVDIRIVAATNVDLESAVRTGQFREDLYYRLNVVQLMLPPLRERIGDIPPLVVAFLDKHKGRSRSIDRVAPDAWSRLLAHSWPGNVRELENVIESALALGFGPVLRAQDLTTITPMEMDAQHQVLDQRRSLEMLEKSAILAAVRDTRGDKIAAAQILGIGRTTLYRKLRYYHSVNSISYVNTDRQGNSHQ